MASGPSFRTSYPASRLSYLTQASTSSSSSSLNAFTPQMRDRQARGKDPYRSGDNSDGSDLSDRETGTASSSGGGGSRMRLTTTRLEKEDFARTERRHKAMAFLDNPELLMMYAQSKGDSIPGARLHFTRMLCGYEKSEAKAKASGPGGSGARKAGTQQLHGGGSGKHAGASSSSAAAAATARKDGDKRRGAGGERPSRA